MKNPINVLRNLVMSCFYEYENKYDWFPESSLSFEKTRFKIKKISVAKTLGYSFTTIGLLLLFLMVLFVVGMAAVGLFIALPVIWGITIWVAPIAAAILIIRYFL